MIERKISIATLYDKDNYSDFKAYSMDMIRWMRISDSLARLGYRVDMIVNTKQGLVQKNANLRYVHYSLFNWENYDIIKTLFHKGFESLCSEGGTNHPYIISKLGSVVGNNDATEGVHFFNEERERLYEIQESIYQKSRFITILTESSRLLWEMEFGNDKGILIVPTGAEIVIPLPRKNPYKEFDEKIAVYIGTIYLNTQREVNLAWQSALNSLGKILKKKGIRLCLVGRGQIDKLDHDVVTYLGPVDNELIWDFHYFADVGISLAQGKVQHNESSKIYCYLRAGLPVVSEEPIPNNFLIKESNLGFISKYGDYQMMGEMIEEAIYSKWQREEAIEYILQNHTWDKRVQIYDSLIRKEFNLAAEDY